MLCAVIVPAFTACTTNTQAFLKVWWTVYAPLSSIVHVPKSKKKVAQIYKIKEKFSVSWSQNRNGISAACPNMATSYLSADNIGHEMMMYQSQTCTSDKILKGINGGKGARDEIRHRFGKMVLPSKSLHHTYCFFCACEARPLAFSLAASAVSRAFSVAVSASVLVGVSPAQQERLA